MIDLNNVKKILRPRLEEHEGVRLKPYHDQHGNLTIGVGRNLDGKGLSRDEVDILFGNDMVDAINQVKDRLPWSVGLDDQRFSVLVEMAFQMGIGGLLLFKRFLAALEKGDHEEAAYQMLNSRWATEDSPGRAKELAFVIRHGGK